MSSHKGNTPRRAVNERTTKPEPNPERQSSRSSGHDRQHVIRQSRSIVYAMMPDAPDPVPQRNRFKPPLTASWPQPADTLPPRVSAPPSPMTDPTPVLVSSLPTSRPSTYPAEKLMAEKSTTTPALMTHVIMVGLPVDMDSAIPARRLFFAADVRSLDELDRRLVLGVQGVGSACLLPER